MKYYAGKTVLVTGATGLIGSCLVEHLMQMDDVQVIALSRSQEKLEEIFKEYMTNPRFEICARDASLPIPEFKRIIDVIFHAASPISGAIIREKPVDIIEPNIIGTKNCLDFLKIQKERTGINGRVVIFSSATVYSNRSNTDRKVCEDDTAVADTIDAANAPYSESKRMVEVLTKAYYKQYNVDSVIARFSYIYGYSHFQPNTAFYEFIRKAVSGTDIVMNNSNLARRDNIYIKDAVNALLLLCSNGKTAESYNISSDGDLDNFMAVDEMAQVIANVVNKISGSTVKVSYLAPKTDGRSPGILLDNSKMKDLGWKIQTSIECGIEETVKEFIANNS